MSGIFNLRPAHIFAGIAGLLLIGVGQSSDSAAQNAAAPPQLDAQLAAGEFAAALASVEKAPADEQPALLKRIAASQAAIGAQPAALRTLSRISDDRQRYEAMRQASSEPITEVVGRPGGVQADFDGLIELMTTTIAPTTWDDVGGPGSVKEFASGVLVDARGVVKPLVKNAAGRDLGELHLAAQQVRRQTGAQHASELRKISLPRLEREVALRLAQGKTPTEEMSVLAGLEKIQYVLVYPESGDLVLAGPASPWLRNADGRAVSAATGRAMLELDDLVVILRQLLDSGDATFGCSIAPNREALERTQAFLAESSKRPLKQSERAAWLKKLRENLGQQDIDVFGIDPRTRVARVLVEADYHMKLIGMGIEPGTLGVESYLNMIKLKPGEQAPPLDVLRWWFTMKYDAVEATPSRDAFELKGQGVQLQSENELLTARGQRVHTGKANPLNQQFAANFTKEFSQLTEKYPLYAELQNLFDLALVAALIETERLHDQALWHLTCFGKDGNYEPLLAEQPKQVDSVINHRIVNKTQILVGVSGGVRADPWKFVRGKAVRENTYGALKAQRSTAKPKDLAQDAWWWD